MKLTGQFYYRFINHYYVNMFSIYPDLKPLNQVWKPLFLSNFLQPMTRILGMGIGLSSGKRPFL